MTRGMVSSGTVPPLETDHSLSDHRIVHMTTELPRREAFEWTTYSYRHFTEEAQADFGHWIITKDWSDVLLATGSNDKARLYQAHVDAAMDKFFPLRTVRRKSSDLPWINKAIRKRIRRRRRVYRREGRSELWKYLKSITDKMIKDRKRTYMDMKKIQLTATDANRSFFRLVKAFNTPEKPQTFDVRSLRPGKTDQEVAEELADHFNRISAEFDGLSPDQIPTTKNRVIDPLMPHEVSSRLKHFRKPKSMVAGDVFPALITKFSDFFAIPLTELFNTIADTQVWPTIWKTEHVTVIPKKSCPESFDDLRNISCTLLVSKVMESFVLEWLGQEVAVKDNQFGGVKGCSGGHMILNAWQRILAGLEDRRAAVVLTSIYYSKAFNRLSFQHCLSSFAKRGASTPLLRMLATFLTNRTMRVRVGSTWSSPRAVTGGCPQGSILGVLLFNMTTDDLEEGSEYVAPSSRPVLESIGDEDSFCNAQADDSMDRSGELLDFYSPDSDEAAEESTDDSFHSAVSSFSGVMASSPAADCPPPVFPGTPVRDGYRFGLALDDSDVRPAGGGRVVYSSEEEVTLLRNRLGPAWASGLPRSSTLINTSTTTSRRTLSTSRTAHPSM